MDKKLLDKVREHILTTSKTAVMKEYLAKKFKVTEHEIQQCFQQLNIEGLLSQARHQIDYSWSPDIYDIINNKKQDTFKGKLLLTNINRAKTLGKDVIKIFIARQQLNNIDRLGWKWASRLAPSYNLVQDIKKHNISWENYHQRYMKEVIYNPNSKPALDVIYNHLKAGENIALICYCNDSRECHRSILGNYYSEFGVNVYDFNYITLIDEFVLALDGIFNEPYANQILNELLNNLNIHAFNWFLRERVMTDRKINFTSIQLTKIINMIHNMQINLQDNNKYYMELAGIIQSYYQLPLDLQNKLESIIIMDKLSQQ